MTERPPEFPHDEIPLLEDDETVPPRPEEEVADVSRAEPDPQGHGAPAEPDPQGHGAPAEPTP